MKSPPLSDALNRVRRALEALIAAARANGGLFPSILDRETGSMRTDLPPPIPGQRNADRAHLGSNLIHDEALLKTLYGLAAAEGRRDFTEAADACLRRFATHCTGTVTGLFPWGEHSFWHLTEDRVGNSYVYHDPARKGWPAIHDHLRQTPLWVWERLWSINPRCVERFAEGLEYHWLEDHSEYIRHANIEVRAYPKRDLRSCDFPRHSGFYIFDWAFAWSKTGRSDFRRQIGAMMDYWWTRRDERGLLQMESRSPETAVRFVGINAPGQTLSLAASLLESAALAEAREPALAAEMRARAAVYIEGFLRAPHDLANGLFALTSRRADNALDTAMPVWGSQYGVWPASYVALTALCAFRLTRDTRLLDWAAAVGRQYAAQPFPTGTAVPAMDAGLGLGLLVDLYDLTGETAWREAALTLAPRLADLYLDAILPRGAAGIGWYESQMGPGFLLHGLARAALAADGIAGLEADYTAR